MRILFLILFSSVSLVAVAGEPVPDNLQPLPPPPAFDPAAEDAPVDEPQITIIKRTEQTVEEYRVGGKLYMIKVTPKVGAPYYLVDDRGDGKFSRQEGLDSGIRPPRWVIRSF